MGRQQTAGFPGKRSSDSVSIGQVIQSLVNLEVPGGKHIALDGSDRNRGDWPELATIDRFPAGVCTSTSRTLNANPLTAAIISDGTNFIASAAAGTMACQYSAAGATWTNVTGFNSASAVRSLVFAGSRTIVCGDGETGMNNGGFAIAAGATSCTALTNGSATTLIQGLAYSPTANSGAGRTAMVRDASTTSIYTLDDGSTVWVARTAPNRSRQAVCWTGSRYISLATGSTWTTVLIETSSAGVTWVDQYLPFTQVSVYSMASDGNKTVVISCLLLFSNQSSYCFLVSKDDGATWHVVPYDMEMPPVGQLVTFVNGKFLASPMGINDGNTITGFSTTGLKWVSEPIPTRGSTSIHTVQGVSYKSGVYCSVGSGVTTESYTFTEDMTKFRLPRIGYSVAANSDMSGVIQHYMKARS